MPGVAPRYGAGQAGVKRGGASRAGRRRTREPEAARSWPIRRACRHARAHRQREGAAAGASRRRPSAGVYRRACRATVWAATPSRTRPIRRGTAGPTRRPASGSGRTGPTPPAGAGAVRAGRAATPETPPGRSGRHRNIRSGSNRSCGACPCSWQRIRRRGDAGTRADRGRPPAPREPASGGRKSGSRWSCPVRGARAAPAQFRPDLLD